MAMACCTKLHERYKNADPEVRRYRKNWIVIYCMSSLVGVGYFIIIPSLHQFVTSSSHPEDPNVKPGLDLNEDWYSWIASMSSFGEFFGAVLLGVLSRWFYIKHLMLVNLFISGVGGLIYGIGKFGWMLLLGRFLQGIFQGGQMTIMRAYLGETSNTVIAMLPPEKQKKSTIKYTNFFVTFTMSTLFAALGPVLPAIAAEIPNLDQFRWPGYYLLCHSFVLTIMVLVLFREKRSDMRRRGSCTVGKLLVPAYTIIFLIFAFFIINSFFSVIDTLENPILSDNFGLTIKYTAYVFAGTVLFFATGNSVVLILQKCGIDNRIISLLVFFTSFSGTIIAADWQAIRGDPCDQFSEKNFDAHSSCHAVLQTRVSNNDYNNTGIAPMGPIDMLVFNSSMVTTCTMLTGLEHLEIAGMCTNCNTSIFYGSLESGINQTQEYEFVCRMQTNLTTLDCYLMIENLCVTVIPSGDFVGSGYGAFRENNTTCDHPRPANVSIEESVTLLMFQVDDTNCVQELCSPSPPANNITYCEQNPHNYECLAGDNNIDIGDCDSNASCICEAFSGSPYHCFWNPNSRITGKYCARCPQLCRSVDHTLNFIQLIVGVSLITAAYPVERLTLTLILSDAMGTAPQGLTMGVLVAAGSIGRFTGPLWGNAAYLSAGRRTYLPMNILSASILLVIVLFLFLYRSMKPRGVSFLPVRTTEEEEEEEGGGGDAREEDQVLLLEHMVLEPQDDYDNEQTTEFIRTQDRSRISLAHEEDPIS